MARKNRSLLVGIPPLALILFVFQTRASARDREFGAVVRTVETTYHVHRSSRFAGWFAGMAVRIAHPEGIKNLRMAIFEHQDFSPHPGEDDFEDAVAGALEQGWRPIVRVWSKRDGERSHIFARERGGDVELFVISVETDEAVVLKMKMNEARFAEMVDNPARLGSSFCHHSEKRTSPAVQEIPTRSPALQRRDSIAEDTPGEGRTAAVRASVPQ